MALPDDVIFVQDASITWGDSGALGVSSGAWLSLNNLASAAGRMGAAINLSPQFPMEAMVQLIVDVGTAPASGTTAELYLAWSSSNSNFPGFVTGADAAYPATVDQNKRQLGNPVSILTAVNTGTISQVQAPVITAVLGQWVAPVTINLLGQTFRNTTAASNNSRVIFTPLRTRAID